jgi:glycosyltransferase involved in cell wall biosynthesis
MRVIQLGPYPPPHGGVQTNLVAIRQLLLQRNITNCVVNLTRHRQANTDGVYYPANAIQVFRLLLQVRYEIVHIHVGGNLSTRLLALCLFCSLLPWSRCVLTFHSGGYPKSRSGRSARWWSMRGFILRRFDRVIAVNSEMAGMFRSFGVAAGRIALVCPYGFATAPAREMPARLKTFFDTHQPILLTVAGLESEYDLPIQFAALAGILAKYPDAGLVIAGSGSLESELRQSINRTSYASHIFLYGDMPHDVTLLAMTNSNVLLRTTLYDGDSIAIREALALGRPVIATDTGMRPEGVRLIPIGDLDALESAIEDCLAEPQVGQHPPPVRALDNNIEAVLNIYNELTGGRAFSPSAHLEASES